MERTRYTIVKRVNEVNMLVLNEHGFPFMFNDAEEANLEKIDQQMIHDEPVLVHATTIGGVL